MQWRHNKVFGDLKNTNLYHPPGSATNFLVASPPPGYRIITGRVERLGESRSSLWFNLAGNVALRIKRDDLVFLNEPELRSLEGKMIQARGWIYKKDNEFRIRIRHSSDLMLIK